MPASVPPEPDLTQTDISQLSPALPEPLPPEPIPDGLAARTARGAGWLIAWQMATRLLGLASTLILARLLIPADFGLVAMAATFTAAVNSLSNLGVADAVVRRPDTGTAWFDTAFTMQFLRGTATAAIIATGAPFATNWFGEPRLVTVLLILAGTALVGAVENIGLLEYRRTMRFDMEFKLLLLPRLLQFTTTTILAFTLSDYRALIAGTVVGSIVRTILSYRLHPYRAWFSLRYWRELLGFSTWTWAASLANLSWERGDSVILGRALSPAALGIYLFSAEIATLPVTELVGPAMRSLYSGLSLARHRGDKVSSIVPEVVLTLLTLVIPISIGISATSGHIVTGLLGPKWEAARPMISAFAWIGCISPIAWVTSSVLVAQGEVRRNFNATALASIARYVVLIPVVWAGGAGWAPWLAVSAVAVEVTLFIWQLGKVEQLEWHRHVGAASRLTLAALVLLVVLWLSDLGWQAEPGPALLVLTEGLALGLAGMAVFWAVQGGLWLQAGRPAGPEQRIVDLGRPVLQRLYRLVA